ncbi:MAG: alpha/beta hydrolase [Alphaproteobacteria bacterium]|uniref:alpha/beta hydrolase n=1 Tax=Bradyrhizobium sp. TaxID=376 RepID=UPI001EB32520|nr:alpha/beta hydrolase [Bradyrhizobium sp.]MBV9570763.1 alpha/beta hydrolase [Alphaproteobacteria bacterium]MBV9979015.1 alpha/beta hydrolase [Bradyrhizobium sp.]
MRLSRVSAVMALSALLSACSPISLLNLAISRSGYRAEKDIAYGPNARQKLDLYIPEGLSKPAPVLLFFYGGTWQSGSKSYYLALGQAFASKGVIVAVADYRLYPEVKYPEFISDGALALRFMHEHAARYGGDPKRLFLAGHSSGAYIVVMLASNPAYLAAVGGNFGWIRGAIGIAGPYDFLPLKDKKLIAIFGGVARKETQPITYVDGPRPPMLLVAGSADDTVSPGNTSRMAGRLREFGNEVETKVYPDVGHLGIILSLAPGFRGRTTLRQDILDFIAKH